MRQAISTSVTLASLLAACPALATEPAEDWQLSVMPYLWATQLKGTSQIRNLPKTEVDMSFSDIMNTLDMGFMGNAELQKGRWGFLFDSIYTKNSESVSASGINASADAKIRLEQTMLSGALAYRWLDQPVSSDAYLGVRYTRIHEQLDLNARTPGATADINQSQAVEWTEPFIGLRGRLPLGDSLALLAGGDVGGFEVGSELTTQVQLGLAYGISERSELQAGYRYMKVEYDKDDFDYNMKTRGPYLGLNYRF